MKYYQKDIFEFFKERARSFLLHSFLGSICSFFLFLFRIILLIWYHLLLILAIQGWWFDLIFYVCISYCWDLVIEFDAMFVFNCLFVLHLIHSFLSFFIFLVSFFSSSFPSFYWDFLGIWLDCVELLSHLLPSF